MRSVPILYFTFLLAVHMIAGCVSVPAPKSYTERIAAGYTGLAMTNDTATILVNGGTITKADGAGVLEKTKAAREALDVAATMQGQIGEDKLLSALNLLRAAQDLLCRDRPTEPNCALLLQRAAP